MVKARQLEDLVIERSQIERVVKGRSFLSTLFRSSICTLFFNLGSWLKGILHFDEWVFEPSFHPMFQLALPERVICKVTLVVGISFPPEVVKHVGIVDRFIAEGIVQLVVSVEDSLLVGTALVLNCLIVYSRELLLHLGHLCSKGFNLTLMPFILPLKGVSHRLLKFHYWFFVVLSDLPQPFGLIIQIICSHFQFLKGLYLARSLIIVQIKSLLCIRILHRAKMPQASHEANNFDLPVIR